MVKKIKKIKHVFVSLQMKHHQLPTSQTVQTRFFFQQFSRSSHGVRGKQLQRQSPGATLAPRAIPWRDLYLELMSSDFFAVQGNVDMFPNLHYICKWVFQIYVSLAMFTLG